MINVLIRKSGRLCFLLLVFFVCDLSAKDLDKEIEACRAYVPSKILQDELKERDLKAVSDYLADDDCYLMTTMIYNSSRNVCYEVIGRVVENKFVALKNGELLFGTPYNEICDYKKLKDNQLLSSYYSGTSFTELYQYNNGSYHLVATDKLVHEVIVKRTYHDESKVQILLNESDDYDKQQQLKAIVKVKTYLYDAADNSSKTKMYFIKDDELILLDIDNERSKEVWYLVKYIRENKPPIVKWVKAEDVVILGL